MHICTAAAAESLQLCPTLCDTIDGSPPGSPVPGILQARTLEWVAISFSNAWKWKVKVKSLSRVRLLGTPWTAVHQAPPFVGFSGQEYWSRVPLPSPTYMLYVYVLYELLAASLHQIYLSLWVLAENFASCWAAGMWRNQHTLLLVAWDECRAPSQPLSTHRWPQAWPVFTGQGLPLGPRLPGALGGGHIPVCLKVSGSASFLLPVLLLSSEFWLLENHSVFPCLEGFCLSLSVKLNTWLHAFSPLKYI